MPCYRCGARQTDPGRGQSPWRRGVRRDCQVLVCPECQGTHDWADDLDKCPRCRSVHLVRRLGEVECRDCGTVVPPPGPGGASGSAGASEAADVSGAGGVSSAGGVTAGEPSHGTQASGLAEEVARALERVLGRSAVRQ
jgi:hypothetical protein